MERLARPFKRLYLRLRRLLGLDKPRCRRLVVEKFTLAWAAKLGVIDALDCVFSRTGSRRVQLILCPPEIPPPDWVSDRCSCPTGSPYPQTVCRVRGVRLGEKGWMVVREVPGS